ncbi:MULTISPECIES: tyrosine-type recombinase/integrase [Caproicibacterium]|uniref:Tyrosine-type recombinase/integrase n=1 Tax=Caproicibacterium argilliputei TaxID=3030016 RepID=A0AA97DBE7_9FIRM|nr:site-specific integrase [Caproicibacterium argilliputei]WOC32346.1 tyrosine-type recombinase/integrase [Caproicibacterium argilliputei]
MEKTTVMDWLKKWNETYSKPNLAEKTYACYKCAIGILNRYHPELQDMPLDELTSLYIQRILNDLAGKYAKSTLNSIRVVFHKAYEAASEIPAFGVSQIGKLYIPKRAAQKIVRALTREEQAKVEAVAQETLLGYVTIFFLRTGLRAEELCNLKWSDYDKKQQVIYIRKSKTKAGVRPVPLNREAQQILLSQPKCRFDNAIFHSSNGNPVTISSLQKLYLRLRRETGIPFITTHVYRHTFATRALEDGMNIKALSQILGHTDVAFTIKQYCSPDLDFLREQTDMIDMRQETTQANTSISILVTQQAKTISDLQKMIEQLQHA